MNRNDITKYLFVFIMCLCLTSCAIIQKTGESIIAVTPQPCINVANQVSNICLFPFSFLMPRKKSIDQVQSLPLGFELMTPGKYEIHANINQWERVGTNLWKSKNKVEFKCNFHDEYIGNQSKSVYLFDYDKIHSRYLIKIDPYRIIRGQFSLFVYIQSTTIPGNVSIDFSDNIKDNKQYIGFQTNFFSCNNIKTKFKFNFKQIEQYSIAIFMNNEEESIVQLKKTVPDIVDKRLEEEDRNIYGDAVLAPVASNELNPVGILLCNKGYYNIKASVYAHEWKKLGDYWQGLMYTFIHNEREYKGLSSQQYSNQKRFELPICNYSKRGLPLLINIKSKNRPPTLNFNFHIHKKNNNPRFISFDNLNNYFFMNGNSPSIIIPDRQNYTFKRSQRQVLCPALILSFININKQNPAKTIIEKKIPVYPESRPVIITPHKKDLPIKKYPQEEPEIIVQPTVITSDPFDVSHKQSVSSGMYFHKPGKYSVQALIFKHEWKNIDGAWIGKLFSFETTNKTKKQVSKGLLYKNDRLDGSRFQVNFGKEQENGQPLIVSIVSQSKPGHLMFKFQKVIQYPLFIPFDEIANAFNLDGTPARWLNNDIPINQKPVVNLFPNKKYSRKKTFNKKSFAPEKIGIVPFSIILTDKLSFNLNKQTIQHFHKIVVDAFQRQTRMKIAVLSYPPNFEPYSLDTIETPEPTIDPIVEDRPEYFFGNICKQSNFNYILFGHFEEDILNNHLDIIIRVFDCASSTYKTYKKKIPVSQVSEKSVHQATKDLIELIKPNIKRTT